MDIARPVPCPCLSGDSYAACCGRLHRGDTTALTAVQLMRSRYAAFSVGDSAYLLSTWHPDTRPRTLVLDPAVRWYRLDIISSERGGMLDTTGVVEFRAWYKHGRSAGDQRETSRFVRDGGRWLYVDGA